MFDPKVRYQIVNGWTGQVLELPGDDISKDAGVRIQFWQNQRAEDQFWHIVPAGAEDHYVISNAFSGKSLGIEEKSKENEAKVAVFDTDLKDPNQQWEFRDAGDGQYHFVNRNSGKALDVLGDDFGPPREDGTWTATGSSSRSCSPTPATSAGSCPGDEGERIDVLDQAYRGSGRHGGGRNARGRPGRGR